jgi:hypothetical protein
MRELDTTVVLFYVNGAKALPPCSFQIYMYNATIEDTPPGANADATTPRLHMQDIQSLSYI